MPVFITNDLYLDDGLNPADYTKDNPLVGWHNLVRDGSLSADSEADDFPASNLLNPSTSEKWKSAISGQQAIYFTAAANTKVDYFGLSTHNFGTDQISYKFQSRQSLQNYQEILVGGDKTGTDIAIDAINGDFDFTVTVDGDIQINVSIAYSSATNVTFTDFINSVNAQLTGATMSLSGGNLRITSDTTTGLDSSVVITDPLGAEAFATYINDFTALGSAEGWIDHISESIPATDRAIMHKFEPVTASFFRLGLDCDSGVFPQLAVVYIGKVLIMQRRLFVGHTPINFGRSTTVMSGESESGNFLGRVVRNTILGSRAKFDEISSAWYREYMEPFVEQSKEYPFFFAWRPGSYPDEVGYCWLTADIVPSNQRGNEAGAMEFEMRFRAKSP